MQKKATSSTLPPSPLNSSSVWQDLSPAPCRCYRLEHSRNAEWRDQSLLDLWVLDPTQHNSPPPPPPSFFPSCPPPRLSSPNHYPPPHPVFLSLFALSVSISQAIHYQLICGVNSSSPQPLPFFILSLKKAKVWLITKVVLSCLIII